MRGAERRDRRCSASSARRRPPRPRRRPGGVGRHPAPVLLAGEPGRPRGEPQPGVQPRRPLPLAGERAGDPAAAELRHRDADLDLPDRVLVGRLHLHVRREPRRLQPHDAELRPDLRRAPVHPRQEQVLLRRQLPARDVGPLRGPGPADGRHQAVPDPRGHEPGRQQPRPVVRGRHHPRRAVHRPHDRHHRAHGQLRAHASASTSASPCRSSASTSGRASSPRSSPSPPARPVRHPPVRRRHAVAHLPRDRQRERHRRRARARQVELPPRRAGQLRRRRRPAPAHREREGPARLGRDAGQAVPGGRRRRRPLLAAGEPRLHVLERRERLHRRPAGRAELHRRLRPRPAPARDVHGRLRRPHPARRRSGS